MSFLPKIHKEIHVPCDPDRLSHDLASELKAHGVSVQEHYPGSRIIGWVFRPLSFSAGQQVRVDFRPIDGMCEAVLQSRFLWPGVDFTHENQRNIDLLESLLTKLSAPQARAA